MCDGCARRSRTRRPNPGGSSRCGEWDTGMSAAPEAAALIGGLPRPGPVVPATASATSPAGGANDAVTELLHMLPVVLAMTIPVIAAGVLLLYLLRKGSLASNLTLLVLVPFTATVCG